MADLEFSKSRGVLRAFGKEYKVRSGIPGTYDALADGNYTIPASALMVGTEQSPPAIFHEKYADAAFVDGKGLGWFLWLGVGNYGIHPDGNVPGTEGCIGLLATDTRPIFNEFKARASTSLTLVVGQTTAGDKAADDKDKFGTCPVDAGDAPKPANPEAPVPPGNAPTGWWPGQFPSASNWLSGWM